MAFVVLAVMSIIALADPAVAQSIRFRVVTEDAYATQCRDGICATVQVTRSTFSDGGSETILFISAYDPSGNPIIPGSFTLIDSSAFVINERGTHATLNHPSAVVTWGVTGLYREESISTTKVIDKRESEFHSPNVVRLTEREHREEAAAEGVAESIIIDTRGIPSAQGFGNALLTTRKTMRIERLIGPEVND
jgi:hypothetical protein